MFTRTSEIDTTFYVTFVCCDKDFLSEYSRVTT